MALKRASVKIRIKREEVLSAVATVPTSSDHTDGSWLDTDIYIGEFSMNTGQLGEASSEEILWLRTVEGIRTIPLVTNAGTTGQFLVKGAKGVSTYQSIQDLTGSVASYTAGAGAIPLTSVVVHYESQGAAEALTLADGYDGQIIRIVHTVDGGSGVLTPATFLGYTTITFNYVGDSVQLEFYTGIGWKVVSNFNTVIV